MKVWLRDHLHFNKPHTRKIPSKPPKLLDILIRCYCAPNGIVVDPFAGSGNFAVCCMNQEKKFIGSELDKSIYDYCLNNITSQREDSKSPNN